MNQNQLNFFVPSVSLPQFGHFTIFSPPYDLKMIFPHSPTAAPTRKAAKMTARSGIKPPPSRPQCTQALP